jgi:hypothetical protein
VAFSCSNLPALSSCQFSPNNSVTPGANGSSITLSLRTTKAVASAAPAPAGGPTETVLATVSWLLPGAFFLAGRSRRWPRSRRRLLTSMGIFLLVLGLMAAGCGGGGGGSVTPIHTSRPGTPPGSYAITVQANAGGLQHPISVNVTVQ